MPRTDEPEKPEEKQTTVRLPKSWHRSLRVKAAEDGKTMNELILEALRHTYPKLPKEFSGATA